MEKTQQNFAVMFADVAGSTHLYERLGDNLANQLISQAIQLASDIIKKHHGVVVKTIGDEVMCRFTDVNQALYCACAIQETMEVQPVKHGIVLMFAIGVHWGPALLRSDGDIFGDAVNLAARMTSMAKARQILTTDITLERVTDSDLAGKCRIIDRMPVKGKSELTSIIDVMWESNDVTHMSTVISDSVALINEQPLHIVYKDIKHIIDPGTPAFTFGRGSTCDLIINSTLASRVHARIETRRGKFILADESTNGTYLQIEDREPIFLRREEMPIQGHGVISFGEELSLDNKHLIRFNF